MTTVSALLTLAAPCAILALAVGRVLRSRAAHKTRLGAWSMVLPLASFTEEPVSEWFNDAPPHAPTLFDVVRELLRSPVPTGAPSSAPALPMHTLSALSRAPRARAASASSIDQQLYRAFASPAPPRRRNTAPGRIQVPRIVVTAPEDDRPWTPGFVVPKQNTSGALLVIPGAPSRTVHFCFRLP